MAKKPIGTIAVPQGMMGLLARAAGGMSDSEGKAETKAKGEERDTKKSRPKFTAKKRHPAMGG